jgi:hypothetical protein
MRSIMTIAIERQHPERGPRGVAVAQAGTCCCCCCCCCLHTVGGVVGALSAFEPPTALPPLPVAAIGEATRPAKHSATGLYWSLTAIVSGLAIAYFVGLESGSVDSETALLLIAICLPGIQLAASLVAALAIGASARPGKDVRLRHLGKITLRALIGAVIGAVVMVPVLCR